MKYDPETMLGDHPGYRFPTTNGTHNFSAPYRKIKVIDSWHPHITTGNLYDLMSAQVTSGSLASLKLNTDTTPAGAWVGVSTAPRGTKWEVQRPCYQTGKTSVSPVAKPTTDPDPVKSTNPRFVKIANKKTSPTISPVNITNPRFVKITPVKTP